MQHTISFALAALALTVSSTPLQAQQEPLSVGRVELCSTYENRRCVEPRTAFGVSDARLYARVHLVNAVAAEDEVSVELQTNDGARRAAITLSVPARRRYRTLARFPMPPSGSYRIVVRSAAGDVLSTTELSVR
ncbi:MAG: hypothetical protein AAF411_01485 [Myxococcota bacterium]